MVMFMALKKDVDVDDVSADDNDGDEHNKVDEDTHTLKGKLYHIS